MSPFVVTINSILYFISGQLKATKGEVRTIWGMLGLGTFGWNRVEPPADRRILITSRSHSNPLVTACVEALSPTHVERQGGAGNKVSIQSACILLYFNNLSLCSNPSVVVIENIHYTYFLTYLLAG